MTLLNGFASVKEKLAELEALQPTKVNLMYVLEAARDVAKLATRIVQTLEKGI